MLVRAQDMATVVREIERKYDAASGGTAALDAVKTMTGTAGVAAVLELPEQLLDAIYYDTADLRLIRAGITLRRRTGGEDAGWHLKLPAGPDTRDEIRLPLTGADGAVPEELAALVPAWTRGAALAPVMRIQTRRRVLRLVDGAGQALAEIAADHVSAEPADGSAATSWDEIEAELVTGGPALLTAIDRQLRRARRPARCHQDQTAAGTGRAARRRACPGTATDQAFARRPGRACLPARPGGRHLAL